MTAWLVQWIAPEELYDLEIDVQFRDVRDHQGIHTAATLRLGLQGEAAQDFGEPAADLFR